MADIGAAAGIVGSGIYRHFGSKSALLSALLEQLMDEMQRSAAAAVAEAAEEGIEVEVDKVTASHLHYGKLQYQVEWKGWDPDATWQYADNLKNAPEALKAYHEEHPDQAGPPLRLQAWLDAAAEDRFDPPHTDDNKPAGTQSARTRRGKRRT